MKRRDCKHVICQTCMQLAATSAVCVMPVSWDVVCRWAPHPVLSITSHHYNRRWETQFSYPWKLHECRANNNYFRYIFFTFYSMYLVLFSIVLHTTIVTVYTNNIFLYNFLWQMHQIIHLSPVGCFPPARGKTMQKNREVSGVNKKKLP